MSQKKKWSRQPRPIKCLETGQIFKNSYEAGVFCGAPATNVTRACQKKRKSVKGYHFCYAEEDLTLEDIEKPKEIKIMDNFNLSEAMDVCFEKNEYFNEMMEIFKQEQEAPLEKHHIIPRSYFRKLGYQIVDDENVVELSASNHFKVHELLTKCSKDIIRENMIDAFLFMSDLNKIKSKDYQEARKEFVEKYGKKVQCVESGIIYNSLRECSREENIDRKDLSRATKTGGRVKGKHYRLVIN